MAEARGLRERLRAGDLLAGTWVSLGDPAVIEVLGASGFDFLLVDGEHAPIDERTLLAQTIAATAADIPIVFRVRQNDTARIKIALDLGVEGIMVPWINSAEDARLAVAAARYPPLGERGIGPWRASNYYADQWDYVQSANDRTALIVQIEQARAVKVVDEIFAVEGIDGALVGPADLGASLGLFGQPDPQLEAAVARIAEAARSAGLALGIDLADPAQLPALRARGLTFFTYGMDIAYIAEGAGSAAKAIGEALSDDGEAADDEAPTNG